MRERISKTNGFAVAGLCLGLTLAVLAGVGLLPILAIVFSGIGLRKSKECGGKGGVISWIGLVLGILYTFLYLKMAGHI